MLMYNEKPPFDGHRVNILDPHHNYIGLGVAYDGSSFCYYEEFINNYLTKSSTNLQNGEVNISFTIPDQFYLIGLSISHDKPFKPMTRKELNTKTSYLDEGETNIFIWDDEVICKENNCEFSFKLKGIRLPMLKCSLVRENRTNLLRILRVHSLFRDGCFIGECNWINLFWIRRYNPITI